MPSMLSPRSLSQDVNRFLEASQGNFIQAVICPRAPERRSCIRGRGSLRGSALAAPASLSQAQRCSPRSHRVLAIAAAARRRMPRAHVPLSYRRPQLIRCRGPSLKETGEFKINDPRCAERILAGGESSHLGRHDWGDWQEAARPVFDRSSETFVVVCDPVHQVPGYSAPHFFRESAHLFCACTPMSRNITVHDSGPRIYQSEQLRRSWTKMSIFAPTWCVGVLWICFFSIREINT